MQKIEAKIKGHAYEKVIFEKEGTPEQLLSEAVAYFQSLNPEGNGILDLLTRVTYAYDLEQRVQIRRDVFGKL